jgi:hypothetical protein
MSDHLLTSKVEVVDHRRRINTIRSAIEYDVINSPHNTEFEELEVTLDEAVRQLDKLYDKLSVHVYAYDVTVTVTRRVYVQASDECDAEQAAIDYAMEDLSPPLDWNEDDVQVFRDEDEETTSVYDVEV